MATKTHIRYILDHTSIDEGEEKTRGRKMATNEQQPHKMQEVSGQPISFSPFLAFGKYQIEVKLLATIF